jgi:cytochrome c biogenesis protein CcmG/thiol:disulfide interchange protein DsbE
MIGIAFQDRPEELKAFFKAEGSPYKHVTFDTTGKLALSFGLRGVPEIFLIRVKDGAVLYHHLGVFTQYNMEHTLLPLLKKLDKKEDSTK